MKIKFKTLQKTLLLAGLFASINVFGQQRLTLEESISRALQNNQQIKNGELIILNSEYQVKEAKGALLPKVDINSQYQYYMSVPSQYAPASNFGGPEGVYNKLTFALPQTTSASIQSSQVLFNQTAVTGVKLARTASEASKLQLELTREELIYNVSATYYGIQVLQDNLGRIRENISNLENTVRINGSLKDNELVSQNVYNRLVINLENLKNQFENQQLSLDHHTTLLNYLMNSEISDSISVEAFDYDEIFLTPIEMSIDQRRDIQLQQMQIKIAEYDKKVSVASYYPTLMAGMALGWAGYNSEFAPGKQLNDDWISNRSFAVSLKIPVFDGFQRNSRVKQKQVAIDRQVNTLSMMKSNAVKEMQDAIDNYRSNTSQVISSKKSLDLAEELFATAQSEFESGITSTTELLNAQNDLSNARTNYSTAVLNLKLAELACRKASGTLVTDYQSEN